MPEYPGLSLLIVDDDLMYLDTIAEILKEHGFKNIEKCSDPREVEGLLEEKRISVILLDLDMPHIDGETLLGFVKSHYPWIPVIIITATSEVTTAVRCMDKGAAYFFCKDKITDQNSNEKRAVIAKIREIIEGRELRLINQQYRTHMLTDELEHQEVFARIITNNKRMINIFHDIEIIARGSGPVLITGESGVGKELVAQCIHTISKREGKLGIANLAGRTDSMIRDELFGHEKGAFTGADSRRKGLIEQSEGGTLFLDEIGDLEPEIQTQLLRFAGEKTYQRIGSDKVRTGDVRIIMATNRNLGKMVKDNEFRKDLYYRLYTHKITLPPLRKRRDDIPLLTAYFTAQVSPDKKIIIPPEVYRIFDTYSFPGNIRELKHIIEMAVDFAVDGVLPVDRIQRHILEEQGVAGEFDDGTSPGDAGPEVSFPGKLPTKDELLERYFREAMKRCGGSLKNKILEQAARLIGVSPETLRLWGKKQDEKDNS